VTLRRFLSKTVNYPLNKIGFHVRSKKALDGLEEGARHLQAELACLAERAGQLQREITRLTDLAHSPVANFTHPETLGLTKRRQEHLASLGLDLMGRTVFEVGAGIGDHTDFFLDRGCKVLSTDGRPENLEVFRDRYFRLFGWYRNIGNLQLASLDIDNPPDEIPGQFEVVYCYGLLYHLDYPKQALDFLSRCCTSLFLLETSVSFGSLENVVRGDEDRKIVSQSIHGRGCHPSRPWVVNRLKELFEFVYVPTTQPWHDQFPIDWVHHVPTPGRAQRAVFVASREKLHSPLLIENLPDYQTRQGGGAPQPLGSPIATHDRMPELAAKARAA
jgi:2-polyprenyl-3-methyl-5-hydroxy-6-metoxy-1,4-benzoquinol methylase